MSEQTREVFQTFGAFWTKEISSTLLAAYLGKPPAEIEFCLDELIIFSLLTKQPETNFYSMHDLTFTFTSLLFRERMGSYLATVDAVENYLVNQRSEFDLLKYDLNNILAAMEMSEGKKLLRMVSYLVLGDFPASAKDSYFTTHGYTLKLLEQLNRAINTAREQSPLYDTNLHYLVGRQGDAHFDLGNYQQVILCYEEALKLAPNEKRRAIIASILARTLAFADRHEDSQSYFVEAYGIADKLKDDVLTCSILGQESFIAGHERNFQRAREIAEKQVEVSTRCLKIKPSPDVYSLQFFAYLNLGCAELDLAKQNRGDFGKALTSHLQAMEIATLQDNNIFRACASTNLGEDYYFLGQKKEARNAFYQALHLWQELGMTKDAQELESLMRSYGIALPKDHK